MSEELNNTIALQQEVLQPDHLFQAYSRYVMEPGLRMEVGRRLGFNKNDPITTDQELATRIIRAEQRTHQKLSELGIESFDEYNQMRAALERGNEEDVAMLHILAAKQQRIRSEREDIRHVVSTKDQFTEANGEYMLSRQAEHSKWVAQALEGIESHDDPDDPPTLLILGGLPGGGKTSAREILRQRVEGGCVVAEPDALREKILPGYDGNDQLQTLQTQQEAFDVSDAIVAAAQGEVVGTDEDGNDIRHGKKNVIIEGTMRNLGWLTEEIKSFYDAGFKIQIVWVHKDPEKCLDTATIYRERGVPLYLLMLALEHGWENFWELAKLPQVEGSMVLQNTLSGANVVFDAARGREAIQDENAMNMIRASNNRFLTQNFS